MFDQISARQIALSGLRAQRTRMNVIANNIANAETTRTTEGGPFQRQLVRLRGHQLHAQAAPDKIGVDVTRLQRDQSPMRSVFDPSHPDSNADGYVMYPNVNVSVEMIDLMSAQRAYEANVAVMASNSRIHQNALRLIEA